MWRVSESQFISSSLSSALLAGRSGGSDSSGSSGPVAGLLAQVSESKVAANKLTTPE